MPRDVTGSAIEAANQLQLILAVQLAGQAEDDFASETCITTPFRCLHRGPQGLPVGHPSRSTVRQGYLAVLDRLAGEVPRATLRGVGQLLPGGVGGGGYRRARVPFRPLVQAG